MKHVCRPMFCAEHKSAAHKSYLKNQSPVCSNDKVVGGLLLID